MSDLICQKPRTPFWLSYSFPNYNKLRSKLDRQFFRLRTPLICPNYGGAIYNVSVLLRTHSGPGQTSLFSCAEPNGCIKCYRRATFDSIKCSKKVKCDRAHLERQGLPHNATLRRDSESNVDPLMCRTKYINYFNLFWP